MYFSNIGNDELQHFHGTIGADFNISLTEILTSDLFDVETIIPDKLFRVYPLFYCREILSSNPADKVLGNRCLIVTQEAHETYFAFTSNGTKTVLNEAVLNIFERNTDLNEDDFNALVYMLRRIGIIARDFNIENNPIITGNYGTYEFQNTNGLRNDTGLIINDALKTTAPLMITLTNPFFLNAKYTLTFTVRSLTGANVCLDEYEDYKVTDTFDIVLTENMPVAVDLTNYVNDAVIDFNIKIQVSFDTPEIVNRASELNITPDQSEILFGDPVTLTAVLSGGDNVEGYNVYFFEDGELIGNGTTDENGECELTYTPQVMSNHIYSCSCLGLTSETRVKVKTQAVELIITATPATVYPPEVFEINGTLTNPLGAIKDAPITILFNNKVMTSSILTNANGGFLMDWLAEDVETFNILAKYPGDEYNAPAESNIATVTARKVNTNLTLDYTMVQTGGNTFRCTIFGRLTNEFNEPLNNKDIDWKIGNMGGTPLKTNSNGEFNHTESFMLSGRQLTMQVTYNGDGGYPGYNGSTATAQWNWR